MISVIKQATSRPLDRAVALLRERILAGDFGANGELPPQGELCREFGVSRSVVREAMQRLQAEGLIAVSQGRRCRVRPMASDSLADGLRLLMRRSDATMIHLGEVRLTVETEIAAKAAERADAALVADLRRAVEDLAAADTTGGRVRADERFHRSLAEASGNPLFVFLLDALTDLLRASREQTIEFGGTEPALRGHREIVAAITDGDPDAARRAMRRHVEESINDHLVASNVRPPGEVRR